MEQIERCGRVLRISDTAEHSENQEDPTEQFVRKMGWVDVPPLYLDGIARFHMETHKDKIFRYVEEHKLQHLVWRDSTRIGFRDYDELYMCKGYLEKKYGTKMWVAIGERCLNDKDTINLMMTVMQQGDSIQEIKKLSYRIQGGRKRTIENGSSPGKIPAYGYDMGAFQGNEEKYRVIYVGWRVCEGEHISIAKPDKPKPNKALQRIKRYPSEKNIEDQIYNDQWDWNSKKGKWDRKRNAPPQDTLLRLVEVPNLERAPYVAKMFELANEPYWHTPYEIARMLTKMGAKPLTDKWEPRAVESVLRNPIYKGKPVDGRNSRAYEYRDDCKEVRQVGWTPIERARNRVVSDEVWESVNKHLNEIEHWYNRTNKSNLDNFWARPFLKCGDCDCRLYIMTEADKCLYRCPKCYCRVVVDAIHDRIQQWYTSIKPISPASDEHDAKIAKLMDELGFGKGAGAIAHWNEAGTQLMKDVQEHMVGDTDEERWHALASKFQGFCGYHGYPDDPVWRDTWTMSKLDPSFDLHFIFQPEQSIFLTRSTGPDIMEVFYLYEASKWEASTHEKITELRVAQERQHKIASMTQDESTIAMCLRTMEDLGRQLGVLEKDACSRTKVERYRKKKEAVRHIGETLHQLAANMQTASGEDKAHKLKPYLDIVFLRFDKEIVDNLPKLINMEIKAKPDFQGVDVGRAECQELVAKYSKRHSQETRAKKSASMKRAYQEGRMARPTEPKRPCVVCKELINVVRKKCPLCEAAQS